MMINPTAHRRRKLPMRLNERERLVGKNCMLVPYMRHHVAKYHQWMSDAELRELTASELLSLEEEYAMQQSWREDPGKLTFIILEKPPTVTIDSINLEQEIQLMVGDVNAFLLSDGEVELSVMVAEKASRGKGIATEACSLMIAYVLKRLRSVTSSGFIARIGASNAESIALFAKLHFRPSGYSHAFQEHTYRLDPNEANSIAAHFDECIDEYLPPE